MGVGTASGQPFVARKPFCFGHASTLSTMPSPSVSFAVLLQPLRSATPASGQGKSPPASRPSGAWLLALAAVVVGAVLVGGCGCPEAHDLEFVGLESPPRTADVTNPALGRAIAQVRLASTADVAHVVDVARRAQPAWGATPPAKRCGLWFDSVFSILPRWQQLIKTNSGTMRNWRMSLGVSN